MAPVFRDDRSLSRNETGDTSLGAGGCRNEIQRTRRPAMGKPMEPIAKTELAAFGVSLRAKAALA